MKKKIVFLLTIMMLLMAACGNAADAGAGDVIVDTGSAVVDNTAVDIGTSDVVVDTLSLNQLMFGTIMLEETDYAVAAEQAETLLPLWQLLQTLSNSNTTAQDEFQAVLKQIQREMTVEQLAYFEGQEFNPQDMFAVAEEMGFDITGDVAGRGTGEGRPEGGAPPGGGIGGGQGGPGGIAGGGTPDPEMQATMEAMRAERGGGSTSAFYDILIEMLEGKLGS